VDISLIVIKKFVLLSRESSRFECYLKAVSGLWRPLDILIITPVNFLDKIERVF
jgi:hypothetical protein